MVLVKEILSQRLYKMFTRKMRVSAENALV